MKRGSLVTVEAVSLRQQLSYRLDSLIDSFWARALHSDVFPVPGGPSFAQTQRDILVILHTLSGTISIT